MRAADAKDGLECYPYFCQYMTVSTICLCVWYLCLLQSLFVLAEIECKYIQFQYQRDALYGGIAMGITKISLKAVSINLQLQEKVLAWSSSIFNASKVYKNIIYTCCSQRMTLRYTCEMTGYSSRTCCMVWNKTCFWGHRDNSDVIQDAGWLHWLPSLTLRFVTATLHGYEGKYISARKLHYTVEISMDKNSKTYASVVFCLNHCKFLFQTGTLQLESGRDFMTRRRNPCIVFVTNFLIPLIPFSPYLSTVQFSYSLLEWFRLISIQFPAFLSHLHLLFYYTNITYYISSDSISCPLPLTTITDWSADLWSWVCNWLGEY